MSIMIHYVEKNIFTAYRICIKSDLEVHGKFLHPFSDLAFIRVGLGLGG